MQRVGLTLKPVHSTISNPLKTQRTGILFVLSAPSGAGKTTLTNALREEPNLVYSVSCTTRSPRLGEASGKDYFFLSDEDFRARLAGGEFLEHAEVHGRCYGTLRSIVLDNLSRGIDVLLDIDTAGAEKIRACEDPIIRAALADIFLLPPGLDELARRLRGRGTESEEQVATRLSNAASEMRHWPDYQYTIVSGSIDENVAAFRAILCAERSLSCRLTLSEL